MLKSMEWKETLRELEGLIAQTLADAKGPIDIDYLNKWVGAYLDAPVHCRMEGNTLHVNVQMPPKPEHIQITIRKYEA